MLIFFALYNKITLFFSLEFGCNWLSVPGADRFCLYTRSQGHTAAGSPGYGAASGTFPSDPPWEGDDFGNTEMGDGKERGAGSGAAALA